MSTVTVENDSRITNIGRILRKTKIDELPQIINILKGDMSFVGPRPELLEYVNYYTEQYKEILTIKPGMTDYAAIQYKDEENLLAKYINHRETYIKKILPEKIKLYKIYLREKCLKSDLKLILLTLVELLPRNTHGVLHQFYHYLDNSMSAFRELA
jgi:lipopolysaccharide/colanic/teichoic acid biosynthesis glycosyltransferase